MFYFTIIITICYFTYLILENHFNKKYLSFFKHIIHVNGIRGKTSVCRLIDASLRYNGYKVFTKTTGSIPSYIDTNNNEHTIKRYGTVNIREQLKTIKKAYKENADILILECMAVNPQLQKISQNKIISSDISVITNVRYDHIFDMGSTLNDIANALSNTIPSKGVLFTASNEYFDFFNNIAQKKNSKAILCNTKFKNDTQIDENISIAYEVAKYIGIDESAFMNSLNLTKYDFGTSKLYKFKNYKNQYYEFLNLFSVNDPESTKNILDKYSQNKNIYFIYNQRLDRPDRLLLFIKHFFSYVNYKKIYIIGNNKRLVKSLLIKNNICNVEILSKKDDLFNLVFQGQALLVGIGNIKGDGYNIIKKLEEESKNE